MTQSIEYPAVGIACLAQPPWKIVSGFVANFTSRQSLLLSVRALAIAIAALLFGGCIVIAFDWMIQFEETWRWILTCVLYLGTLFVAWKLGLSHLFFPPSIDQIAWSIEQSHPSLREGLMACVELRWPDGSTRCASPLFLEAIERNVAKELSYIDVKSLLPWKQVYRSMFLLAAMLWGIFVACFIPNSNFGLRFAKAIIPFVSFDESAGKTNKNPAAKPPRVLAFHTEVVPPDYAGLPNQKTTTARGDLKVLKGSRVKLEIDVDQTIANANISMDFSDSGRKQSLSIEQVRNLGSTPLVPDAVQRFSTEFLVDEDGLYEIRLATDRKINGKRLENIYSPRYRIDAMKDSPPNLAWLTTDATVWRDLPLPDQKFLVAYDASLDLSMRVSDNLPVEQLTQEASINRGPWLTTPNRLITSEWTNKAQANTTNPYTQTWTSDLHWTLDLAKLQVRNGDSVATRVAATDRKGNTTHSQTVQFSLVATGFDRNRHNSLLFRSSLVPLLESISVSLNQSKEALQSNADRLKNIALSEEELQATQSEFRTMIDLSVKACQELRTTARKLVRELPRCVDQNEVELVSRLVGRVEKEWLAEIKFCINSFVPPSSTNLDAKSTEWHIEEHQSKIDRMRKAYDLACENAKRAASIFRQFIGLELQAALTQDLTELRDYQQSDLHRNSLDDSTELSRTCEVTIQYLDSITKLTLAIEPNLPPELQRRLGEMHQWIDQTRADFSDLNKSEGNEKSSLEVRNRIERTSEELKRVRWAYNLHSGLGLEATTGRKELLIRSGSLWSSFSRFLERQASLIAFSKERTQSTNLLIKRTNAILDEATGPILSALSQMIDRRDIHQQRTHTDPQFASDMGMAYRAWTNLIERWALEPANADRFSLESQSIAEAYRVLESAHETVEARLVLQSLLPIEQYEWRTLEARLWSPKQWDTINLQLEVAQLWMREAGFANSIADKYNQLRGSDASRRITSKLNPRRDANSTNMVSIADEMRSLLLLWSEADLAAKPLVESARATLAKYSPAVSQLAKQAAESTERMQATAVQVNPTTTSELSKSQGNEHHSNPPLQQLQMERVKNKQQIAQLQDALIELANKQNILNKVELDTARDSDNSLKLLNQALPAMDNKTNDLIASVNTQMQINSEVTREAVNAMSGTAEVLNKISDHFLILEELARVSNRPQGLEESREELRSKIEEGASSSNGNSPQRDEEEDYKRAEDLAALASSDAKSLLEKLEGELQSNPLMKSELSEISQAIAESLATELQIAAEMEISLSSELENSDGQLFGEKRMKLDRLKTVTEQIDRLASKMLDHSQQAAKRATAKEEAFALEQAGKDLRGVTQRVRSLSDDTLRIDIESTSKQLLEQMETTLGKSLASSRNLNASKEQKTHKDERSRQNARTEAQNLQIQSQNEFLHQAREFVAHSQRQLEAATKRLQKSQSELESATQDRRAAQEKRTMEPANEYFANHLRRMTNSVEQAFVKRKWEESIQLQAAQAILNAKEQLSLLERKEKTELDRPSPHAALAVEHLDRAMEQLTQLKRDVVAIDEAIKKLPKPHAPFATLRSDLTKQRQIVDSVWDVSQQLARSARHEERLDNAAAAERLRFQVQSVRQLATGSVAQAAKELSLNVNLAEQQEQKQADAKTHDEIADSFTRSDSSATQQGFMTASRELSAESEKLREQIGGMAAQRTSLDKTAKPQTSVEQGRDTRQLEARDMARMLDLLDRQLNAESVSNDAKRSSSPSSADAESSPGDTSSDSKRSTDQTPSSTQSDDDRNGARNASAFKDSLKSSSERLAGAMGQRRITQRAASLSPRNARNSSLQTPLRGTQAEPDLTSIESGGEFVLPGMTRVPNRDWGKLRDQRTQDAVEGRRDEYDPEFEEAIHAYYRALGNR